MSYAVSQLPGLRVMLLPCTKWWLLYFSYCRSRLEKKAPVSISYHWALTTSSSRGWWEHVTQTHQFPFSYTAVDVHSCTSEAWIIDKRNDLLHNAPISIFYLQLFLCDIRKKSKSSEGPGRSEILGESEKCVVKLGELIWDFRHYLFNTDQWCLFCLLM